MVGSLPNSPNTVFWRRRLRSIAGESGVAYLFLLPSIVFLASFTLWPILWAIWASFQRSAGRGYVFVGLRNYIRIFSDPNAQLVIANAVIYVTFGVVIAVFGGLLLAVLMNQSLKRIGILRFPFLVTLALPMVSVASIWLFLYTPHVGLINEVMATFGLPRVNWLGDRDFALPSLFVVYTWKQIGFFALFYLAALQAISSDVLDAANIDGVQFWTRLRHVIWPLVSPTTYFVSTIAVMSALQQIDHVYVLTEGGPNNASNMALYYVYEQGFKYLKVGPAAAVTVMMLAVLLSIAILQYVYLERRIHYD